MRVTQPGQGDTSATESATECHQVERSPTNAGNSTVLDTVASVPGVTKQGAGGHEAPVPSNSQPVSGVGSGVGIKFTGDEGVGLPGDVEKVELREGLRNLQGGSNRGAMASNRGDGGVVGGNVPVRGKATRVEPQSGNGEEMYWPGGVE